MQQSEIDGCLTLLRAQGGIWYVGCGWQWANSATATAILMRTLERRGLVQRCVTPTRVEWRLCGAPRPEPTPLATRRGGAPGAQPSA